MKFKRLLTLIVTFMMLLTFAAPAASGQAYAAQTTNININGTEIAFTDSSGYPFVDENSRTQVPFRVTLETIGCSVSWNAETRTAVASRGDVTVEVPIGEKYILKNGEIVQNDTAALIKGGRTYLPIRVVLESFGYTVSWEQSTRTVIATGNTEASPLPEINIHFIDVGQGDSTFIDVGEYEILIDAGAPDAGNTVKNYIKYYVDGPLELVIATHAHDDHYGGLPTVFDAFNISKIIYSGEINDNYSYNKFIEAAVSENCPFISDVTETMFFDALRVDIIDVTDDDSNKNNNSVVTLFTYGDFKFLASGDAESKIEKIIKTKVSDVDVWKAGHHGSSTSNSKSLLSVIKPEYTIISAEEGNSYGHPHIEALTNIFTYGKALGTFKSGTIVLTTDGDTYSFNSQKYLTYSDAGSASESDVTSGDSYYEDYYDNYVNDYTDSGINSGYIGNSNTMVFHVDTCSYVDRMSEKNKVHGLTMQQLISKGYRPCEKCL